MEPAEKGVRLTQRELAKQLGVSQASISRALAGHPRHSEAFRAKVRSLAEQRAYRPDPVLSSLNAYRRTKRPISAGGSLLWLGSSTGPNADDYDPKLYRAGKERAERLGYGLDYVSLAEPGMTPKRLARISAARGAPGIILGPRQEVRAHIDIDLQRLAAVALGRSIETPVVDLVSTDHSQTMELCFRRVVEKGYRRIAFTLTSNFNERVSALWSGTYLGQQLRHPFVAPIPPLLDDERHEPKQFLAWFRKWKPDAIITIGWHFGCLGVLGKLGIRYPDDVAVALLSVPEDQPQLAGFSGIREPAEVLASFAVSLLIGQVRNNERGVPENRCIHLLPGRWIDGVTA